MWELLSGEFYENLRFRFPANVLNCWVLDVCWMGNVFQPVNECIRLSFVSEFIYRTWIGCSVTTIWNQHIQQTNKLSGFSQSWRSGFSQSWRLRQSISRNWGFEEKFMFGSVRICRPLYWSRFEFSATVALSQTHPSSPHSCTTKLISQRSATTSLPRTIRRSRQRDNFPSARSDPRAVYVKQSAVDSQSQVILLFPSFHACLSTPSLLWMPVITFLEYIFVHFVDAAFEWIVDDSIDDLLWCR